MSLASLRPHLVALLALALPLTGSHLARQAIGVTDTVMIGWYGVEPLAGVILATSSFYIVYMLGSGYGHAVLGLIAAAMARKDETEVRRATRMALWLSALHSLAMMPIMWWSGPILLALGQKPGVAAYAQEYLRVMGWAMWPTLWGLTLNSFLAALGRPNIVMVITVAGIPINMLLNWMLIFGHLGAPELGVTGSALASLSVALFQMVLLIFCASLLPEARRFQLFQRFWRPDWETMRAVILLGLPIGLTMVAEVGMFTGTNIMMGWFGPDYLAAHGIALQLGSIAFMIHLGLSNAVTIRVGGLHGHGARDEMRLAGHAGIILSIFFATLTIAIFLTLSRQIAGLYLDASDPLTPTIIALVASLMIYSSAFQLADGMQVIALGMLRGVQDTRIPMILAIISYWAVGIPTGWFLAIHAGMGPPGLWIGLLAGLSTAAVLLMIRFWRGFARGWTPGARAG